MTLDPNTHQQLLELIYGLLPEAEAAELHERIGSDPELARAYTEARGTADLFEQAARLKSPPVPLVRPEEPAPRGAQKLQPKTPIRPERTMNTPPPLPTKPQPRVRPADSRRTWARGASWVVGLTATVLLMVPIGLYTYHREQIRAIAAEHLHFRVTGPAAMQEGANAEYTISTTAVTGDAVPTQVEFALYSPDGSRLLGHKETTDDDGLLKVTIPGDMALPSRTRLEVVALHGGSREEVETQLNVEPIRYVTHLSLDKPLYRPGETVYYRSLTLSRFGLAADREMPIHFEILDPSGAVVPNSQNEGATERGVGSGVFEIPAELAGGEYSLVARSLDEAFPDEKRPLPIRRYRLPRLKKELEFARDSYTPGDEVVADFIAERAEGGAAADAQLRIVATVDGETVFLKNERADQSGAFQVKFELPDEIQRGDGQLAVIVDDGGTRETIAKTIPINLGKVEVAFYPEGGDLVAGLENRVYFIGRDPLGEPVHVEGIITGSSGAEVALAETTHEGMGSFSFMPAADEKYHLKITSPAGVDHKPELPEVSTEQKIVLSTGSGVFDSSAPLEFNIRASEPGLPLIAAAYCRSVPVGQQALITEVGESSSDGTNAVVIPLADGVGGVIRLTVYDYSVNPPKPVAERLVYRRMGRALDVQMTAANEKYAPGEKVELSLAVTNEEGKPVPAVLGLAVVDDALLSLADDDTASLPTQMLLTSEVENPEDLEEADFYLGAGVDSAVALDLLLGVQGWRRFVEKTLPEIEQEDDLKEQLTRLVAIGGSAAPPAMFDNLDQLKTRYQESLDDYRADRTQPLRTLTTVSFFAGMGLVLLVAMLGLLKVVQGVHLWVPAVGVTICCLIIGAILMDPSRLTSGPNGAVAFRTFSLEPIEVAAADPLSKMREGDKPGDQRDEEDAAAEADDWGDAPDELAEFDDKIHEGEEEIHGERDEKKEKEEFKGDLDEVLQDRIARLGPNDALFGLERLPDGKRLDLRELAQMGKEMRRKRRWDRDKLDAGVKWVDLGADYAKNLERYRFTFREYAHQHVAGEPGVRSDFTETVYWNPRLIADADGKASVSFDLSDSITTFNIRADAHGDGRIGSDGSEIVSRIPFNIEPKLPLEVNAGDRIDLPVAVVNDTAGELPVELKLEHGELVELDGEAQRKLELQPRQRGREYFVLNVSGEKGDCELTLRGTAGNLGDAVSRPLRVVPPGFPKSISHSGQIEGEQEVLVELPEYWVAGSLEVTLSAFPSTLADLQQGMESILREPNGCFEQASTSNYPNVLSLQYMQEHNVANPAVTRRAKDLLKKGYVKLTGYECSEKGYEWFGGDPGHEALTAYGLMEFRDMAQVYDVDEEMIRRTAQWLLERRDGKGGFKRNARALDSFGRAPDEITNAYVTWALAESGQEEIDAEVEHIVAVAEKSDDPYLIALAAASAVNSGKKPEASKLMERLTEMQEDDGHFEGKQGSITRSGGRSLQVETTALAAIAWLKMPAFAAQAGKAVEWIVNSRGGSGGFGSTQATILALKALVQHSKTARHTLTEGTLIIKREDQQIGEHAFGAGQQETIAIDGLEAELTSGENKLTVSLSGDNKMPYALDVSFRTRKPESDEKCPVRLSTKLAAGKVNAGETIALEAELVNTSDEGQPMTIAIMGLPAGLEPRVDQLDELKEAGAFDYYETRPRQVICYWRSLAPKKKAAVKLDLVAAVPGHYVGPASRTYLYYTSEQKQWCDPLEVEITRE